MKKVVAIILMLVMLVGLLVACGENTSQVSASNGSMFVQVELGVDYKVVYHRETKVMYAVSDSSYNRGT